VEETALEQVLAVLGVPVVACDDAGRVVVANRAANGLLGAPGGLVGAALADLVPERLRSSDGVALLDRLAARAHAADPAPVRLTLLHRGGVEIDVDCVASGGGDAPLVLAFEVIRDETETRPRPGSYELIFEHAPLGILHFDAHGVITACNQNFVAIIGSSRSVLVGLNMLSLPDRAMVACVRQALGGEMASYEGPYRSATADKTTPVSVLFAPVVEAGTITGGVGIIRDVTEAQALRERLAQSDRLAALGTLAAGVAHEINNPLTYVMSSIETAKRALDRDHGDGRVGRYLETALEGADRIRRIVRDLRIFSRAEDQPRTPVDVHAVLDAAANLCGSVIRHRGRLVKRYGDVPPVWADEVRLGQVFVNVLVNAAHAIPEDAQTEHWIEVSTEAIDDGHVAIEIADNGAGIPADLLPRVFEPFVTTKPVGVGTGLGLSICHSIVTSLGGEITVDSEPGRGTAVRIVLPRATGAAAARPLPARAHSDESPPALRPMRWLLVDDEPRVIEALAAILADRQHEVRIATSGAEALASLAADAHVDVVLCDVMMAGKNGLDVYEELRRQHPELEERFVFMSGGVMSAEIFADLAATGRPRVAKPFTVEQLEAVLDAHGIARATAPAGG